MRSKNMTKPQLELSKTIWLQFFHLLSITSLLTGLLTAGLYVGVWLAMLSNLEPSLRDALTLGLEAQLPKDFQFLNNLPLRGLFIVVALVSLLIGGLVCTTIAGLWVRRLLRPLSQMAGSLQRLAGGDLAARSPIVGDGPLLALIADMNRVAERLERGDAERKLTAAAVAHDLRTPLSTLRVRLDGLEDGILMLSPEEFRRLHQQLDVLERLVEDLQLLSLAEAGGLRLERDHVDVIMLLHEAFEEFAPLAERGNVQFMPIFKQIDEHVTITGDYMRLRQVVTNILSNALRHTPPTGHIQAKVSRPRLGAVRIDLEDTGPGVSESELSWVFRRFYRGESSRSRQHGGSGLGLAIVESLVEAHGGRVWAYRSGLGGLGIAIELLATE
jgi:two-component system, OmpR family, sensor histidine kinase BaeS